MTDEKYEAPKPKSIEMVTVRVVRQGKTALVEWMEGDTYQRCLVPSGKVIDGQVAKGTLGMGIPYGLDLEKMITLHHGTAAQVANELHKQGIWTFEDLQQRLPAVKAAFWNAFNVDIAGLLKKAQEAKNG